MRNPSAGRTLSVLHRYGAALSVATLLLWCRAHAQEDPHDWVLKSYRISASQEASFARDGILSPFWSVWDRTNSGGAASLDYIDMTTTQNAWCTDGGSFSGPDDAELIVRSAYGANGLYLYFEVHDDNWQDGTGESNALDFMLDTMSSREIRECNPLSCLVQPSWSWSLTPHSIQFQVTTGGGSVPSNIRVNYFDGANMYWGNEPIANLATTYGGANIDVVVPRQSVRVLEMYIPWAWVGANGGVGSLPAEGRDIALYAGYLDIDAGQSTLANTDLVWREKSPYNSCQDMSPPHDFCNAWGDIQIAGPLPTDSGSINVVSPNGGETWTTGEARDLIWNTNGVIGSVGIQYSINTGADWTTIASGVPNTGFYTWTVPDVLSRNCLIRVSGAPSSTSSDVSDSMFTISPRGRVLGRAAPTGFGIGVPRYDPRNGTVSLTLHLSSAGPVTLELYAMEGRLVRSLEWNGSAAGSCQLHASVGRPLGTGTYLTRVRIGDRLFRDRMVVAPH
jgi:hypothetical protein